jgi:hypothetical protein
MSRYDYTFDLIWKVRYIFTSDKIQYTVYWIVVFEILILVPSFMIFPDYCLWHLFYA